MTVSERKQTISLPLKFVFTEEGASAMFRQNVQIKRLKMGDQTEHYGVFLEKITSDFIQRMIMMNYISKIEVSGVEPLESRGEILELSKLIVLSILYRNFAEITQEKILAANPVKKWNYSNPSMVIDEKTQFKDGMLQSLMERNTEDINKIQQELIIPIDKSTDEDPDLQEDEKKQRKELLREFVSASYPITWFVLLKFLNTPDFLPLLRIVRHCLVEALKKINLAEYSSLMLMELAANIANLNIQKEAKVLYKAKHVDVKAFIQDPKLRFPVIESLRKKNSLLTFSWKLGGANLAIGSRGRFQIVLYDQDMHYAATRESVAQSKSADAKRFNLSEFYKKLFSSGNDLDLGIFYLSFLDEACSNMGIKFESMVNQSQFSGAGQTITTLTFTL